MARILVTGSSDGVGAIVAKRLIDSGHSVVLHARNAQRAQDATVKCPGAETVVTGDLSSLEETKALADKVNKLCAFDSIIHNAALFQGPFRKTADGVPALVAVNTLAPYVLTCLINRPKRLVFLSSDMHREGDGQLRDVLWTERGESKWDEEAAYSASKLHNIMFAKAFARRWPEVKSNAMDPGWLPTKMGGSDATGSMEDAVQTYLLLALGGGAEGEQSGGYFEPGKKLTASLAAADDEKAQDRLLGICAEFTGVQLP